MTFFMADGFLLDQIIDPELDRGAVREDVRGVHARPDGDDRAGLDVLRQAVGEPMGLHFEISQHFLDEPAQRAGFVLLGAFLAAFLFIRTSARLIRSPSVELVAGQRDDRQRPAPAPPRLGDRAAAALGLSQLRARAAPARGWTCSRRCSGSAPG